MLSPDYLDHIADDLLVMYAELDELIVRDIARRLVSTGVVTASAERQAIVLRDSGLLYEDVVAEVAKAADASDAQVRALFEDAGMEATKWDREVYLAAGLSPPPIRQSEIAWRTLMAGAKKTSGNLRNLTMTTASQAQQAYIEAATIAEMQVESGAFSYGVAIRDAVKKAAEDGAWVSYPSGHRDRLDVAVRRAVLTGVGQTCAEVGLAYADEMGCDLVETTAHPGARPSHVEWQGRVFSRSGRHPRYPQFEAATGYGTGGGLCGYNCRHSFFPFFEGLSEKAYPRALINQYEDMEVTYNGETLKYYDATQRQRAMERRIRERKRIFAGYEEAAKAAPNEKIRADLETDMAMEAMKLKRQEAALRDFLRQTGLRKDGIREQVWAARKGGNLVSFSRSQTQTAVQRDKAMKSYKALAGTKAATGEKITVTDHLAARVVARKIPIADVKDALTNPIKEGTVRVETDGRKSRQLIGKSAIVVVNPETGNLITAWRTSRKKAGKEAQS